ncbi:MAG: ribonuclease P protein component [Nitrosomonas oligotropha]|uniref:Ribonuclease P protein component n=1 Tax=Nitrosomonas oligotropha TaxID=42354 RepID=A0A5C7VRM8_9PROT|nr:MAG: ribonuclease P protein component [Nitrosomonas oligotropha]
MFRFVETYSLPKSYRLHKATEFAAVINLRCQINGDLIQIYMKPNEFEYARLGLIVSKRMERSAVKRNKIKRILRETFRKNRFYDQTIKMDWVIRLRRPVPRNELKKLAAETQLLMLQLQQCHG